MVKGAAYKAARTAKLYTAQIYRAVSIKLIITLPDGIPLSGQTVNINGTNMATGSTGQRSPTVSSPQVTTGEMFSLAFTMMVSGPGQNFSANKRALGDTSRP